MSKTITIAVDVMGGDHGPGAVVRGTVNALQANPEVHAQIFGNEKSVAPLLAELGAEMRARVTLVATDELVTMDDSPATALRKKPNSSMALAIKSVAAGECSACVSCGNTGALVTLSTVYLKTHASIKRPALLSSIPSLGGGTVMLDLGANVSCPGELLAQFAVMGAAASTSLYGFDSPRVGLLNIGTEDGKGLESHATANQLLQNSGLNYQGFIEGRDIFSSDIDVVVSDGYAGNIALKSLEGQAEYLIKKLQNNAAAYQEVRDLLDPRPHNGATLLGLLGVVVKSHGNADEWAVQHAVQTSIDEVQAGLLTRIAAGINHYHEHTGEAGVQ